LLAAPSSLFAQAPEKARRIGFLSPDAADSAFGKYVQPTFSDSLRRLGYAVGRDLLIEWRWGDGKLSSLPPLAEELVKLKVEIIVARSGAIPAAMDATRSIPIVMLNGNFPVEVGWIKSLAKPGGNVTGTTFTAPETIEKTLQLLKEFVPRVTRAGIFLTDNAMKGEWGKIYLGSVRRAAVSLGMTVEQFSVGKGTLEEVMAALENMATRGIEALIYPAELAYRVHTNAIAAFLRDRKIISAGPGVGFALLGGLFDYGPDARANFERTASYVDRILRGARPADLPVELPAKFELIVNLKTAKALGIAVPPSILLRADRVIE
jgi:putative ABC transport system substrate-binding protein